MNNGGNTGGVSGVDTLAWWVAMYAIDGLVVVVCAGFGGS